MLIGIDASRAARRERTGTERYSLEIIRHLLRLPIASAHQWRLYIDDSERETFIRDLALDDRANVEIRQLPSRRMWTHRALSKEVLIDRPDIFFVPSHVIPFVAPPSRLPTCVVTVHDLGYRAWPEMHTRKQRAYLDLSTRWSVKVATRVICVSQATADDLQEAYGTDQAKISVVHEGINLPAFASHGLVSGHHSSTLCDRPYALYVGTIQPRKNLARIMQAYANLVASHSIEWDLVLAGKPGWYSDSLFQQAHELNLADRIHLPGYVPDNDLPALLENARFFCFPSLHEGFGLPVLEAQAMGVPLVTANNSSLPEIAGDAALLVDPTDVDAIANAMLRLSHDEALRQQLIAAGYENVKRFSWEKAAVETLAVLERAASEGHTVGMEETTDGQTDG